VRSVTFVALGSSFTAVFIMMACASTEEVPASPKTEQEDASSQITSKVPEASSPPADPPPAKKCVTKCSADLDCQNSCPSPLSGAYCCDVSTGTCYNNATSVCPTPTPDAGDPPPAY
jgi:hypothetical protein